MGTRKTNAIRGFAACDTRWHPDQLVAVGATATSSAYTQARPRTGSAVPADPLSALRPAVSGAQSVGVDVRLSKGGHAGVDDSAAQVIYKSSDEAATHWRGWNAPSWLHRWQVLKHDTTAWFYHDCVTVPSSQTVIGVAGTAAGAAEVYRRSPSTGTWSAGGVPATVTRGPYALVVLPSERVLLICLDATPGAPTVWASDDEGASWVLHSLNPFLGNLRTVATVTADACMVGGEVLLVCKEAGSTVRQYASRDLGSTFDLVGTWTGDTPRCSSTALGAFVAWRDGSANGVGAPVTHAYEDISAITAATIQASMHADGALEVVGDADGSLYLFGLASTGAHTVKVSTDNGDTWLTIASGWATLGTASAYLYGYKACATAGEIVMLHRFAGVGGAYADKSLAACVLGGWSNVGQPASSGSAIAYPIIAEREGWPRADAVDGCIWVPAGLPDGYSYWSLTSGATAGDRSIAAPGELHIDSASGSTCGFTRAPSTALDEILMLFEVRVVQGGSLTSADIGASMACTTSNSAFVHLCATATGFGLYDPTASAAVGTAATVDLTANTQILVYLSARTLTASTWYRSPTSRAWTAGPTGSITGAPPAVVASAWGHLASAATTRESYWRLVGRATVDHIAPNPAIGLASPMGKALGARSYPLPAMGSTDFARLALTSGPGRHADAWTVPAEFDYPVRELFPTVSPSPARRWRSTGKASTVSFVLDFGEATRLGASWSTVLYLGAANFRNALLRRWDGSAWQTLGAWDGATGFAGLGYELTGNVIRPTAGTSTAGRWINDGELVGWRAHLPSGKVRRIVRNSGGSWSTATTVRPELVLEGIDGTEAASGVVDLVSPAGVLVVNQTNAAANYTRYMLLTIASGQDTPPDEDYYQIGVALLGGLHAVGKQWSDNYAVARSPNVASSTDAHGSRQVRQLGPSPQSMTVAWQDGQRLEAMRSAALDPDYLGTSAGAPLVAEHDVLGQLQGLQAATLGGQVPVVALSVVPDAATSFTSDRSLYTYGHLTGLRVQANVVNGDENESEFIRVESVTIEEAV